MGKREGYLRHRPCLSLWRVEIWGRKSDYMGAYGRVGLIPTETPGSPGGPRSPGSPVGPWKTEQGLGTSLNYRAFIRLFAT